MLHKDASPSCLHAFMLAQPKISQDDILCTGSSADASRVISGIQGSLRHISERDEASVHMTPMMMHKS